MQRKLLGILTAGRGEVPGNKAMFRLVQEAGRQAGLTAFVFTPERVDWRRRTVVGYRYGKGQWRAGRYPLPHVVYNRVPNRRLEASKQVRFAKQQLRAQGIPYYNARYLNKYDLYRVLKQDPAIEPYLPWTKLVGSRADILTGLKKFGSVYLKPRHAFAGKGILRLSLQGRNWSLRYRQANRNRVVRGSELAALWPILERHMGRQSYIVQQAISLATFRGRPFDVRLLAQKNGSGRWQVSGMGMRVAGKGSITTHVPNGGYIAAAAQVFPAVFGIKAADVQKEVSHLAMQIAPRIEQAYAGLFGEMSMDIGLDMQGRPWFFEANAKPMRFDEKTIRRAGLQTLVAYVKFLTGETSERR